MKAHDVRDELRGVVHAAGAPYGFTLTMWASGSLTLHQLGARPFLVILLFVSGSIAAFVAVATLAAGDAGMTIPRSESANTPTPVAALLHLGACGTAICTAEATLMLIPGYGAALVVGASATAIYMTICAVQFSIARVWHEHRQPGQR